MKIHEILAVLAPKSTDRSDRFCRRLDAHLETLADDDARAKFLASQLAHWQELYRAWAVGIDSGVLPITPETATANDYILTIAEIGTRQAKFALVSA